ncbi:MAG: hypothetical protein OSJ43_11930 [Oscillospiraceae bacterium]|nr:hypothetical protein [Oscillospiraceae bacterium]
MSNNAEMMEDFKKLTEKYEAICNEQSLHPQHLKKLKWTIILIVHFLLLHLDYYAKMWYNISWSFMLQYNERGSLND